MTISYGHGLSSSPMHLAAGYAAIANGGYRVKPTLLKQTGPQLGERVMSPRAASDARKMLRAVVAEGTASMADIEGYHVGGKTGTAEKPSNGSYSLDENISSFAAIFPSDSPEFVVLIVLDAPKSGESWGRTASWNAAPTAGRVVERIAPILGVEPELEAARMPHPSDETSERSRL